MATFQKRGNSWRAEINRKGFMKPATFRTKAQPTAWAVKAEAELFDGIKAQGRRRQDPQRTAGALRPRGPRQEAWTQVGE